MLHYIIDGNNLIGKIKPLIDLQKKNKQASREKLVFLLDRYFRNKKFKVTLHFDGFQSDYLGSHNMNIVYSENLTADEKIKAQIESIKSTKNIVVVTSDLNLAEFARVCFCKVIASDEFYRIIEKENKSDDEADRIKQIDNDEIINLFNSVNKKAKDSF